MTRKFFGTDGIRGRANNPTSRVRLEARFGADSLQPLVQMPLHNPVPAKLRITERHYKLKTFRQLGVC